MSENEARHKLIVALAGTSRGKQRVFYDAMPAAAARLAALRAPSGDNHNISNRYSVFRHSAAELDRAAVCLHNRLRGVGITANTMDSR